MADIEELVRKGTLEEFLEVYEPGDATAWRGYEDITLLHRAAGNVDPASRVAIASRLLDDGADASAIAMREKFTVLHMLFAASRHDFEAEAPLLERLLDAGADINHVAGGNWGTPIQTLASNLKFSDDRLTPFYEVIFARPDLDLLKPGKKGRTDLDSARLLNFKRENLTARIEAYLHHHGREVPSAPPTRATPP